jgi:hypothetical protein
VPDPARVPVPGVTDPPAAEPDPDVVGGTVTVPEPEPLPIVEPLALEPVPGVVELPEPEPLPIVEPLALEPVPGVVELPELEMVPDATPGHCGPPGVVVLPEGDVCWALAVSAIVKTPTVSAAIANRFIGSAFLLSATEAYCLGEVSCLGTRIFRGGSPSDKPGVAKRAPGDLAPGASMLGVQP